MFRGESERTPDALDMTCAAQRDDVQLRTLAAHDHVHATAVEFEAKSRVHGRIT